MNPITITTVASALAFVGAAAILATSNRTKKPPVEDPERLSDGGIDKRPSQPASLSTRVLALLSWRGFLPRPPATVRGAGVCRGAGLGFSSFPCAANPRRVGTPCPPSLRKRQFFGRHTLLGTGCPPYKKIGAPIRELFHR